MFRIIIPEKVAFYKSVKSSGRSYRIINNQGYGVYLNIIAPFATIQDDFTPNDFEEDIIRIDHLSYFIAENVTLTIYNEGPELLVYKIQSDGFCRYIKVKKDQKEITTELQEIANYKIGKILLLDAF